MLLAHRRELLANISDRPRRRATRGVCPQGSDRPRGGPRFRTSDIRPMRATVPQAALHKLRNRSTTSKVARGRDTMAARPHTAPTRPCTRMTRTPDDITNSLPSTTHTSCAQGSVKFARQTQAPRKGALRTTVKHRRDLGSPLAGFRTPQAELGRKPTQMSRAQGRPNLAAVRAVGTEARSAKHSELPTIGAWHNDGVTQAPTQLATFVVAPCNPRGGVWSAVTLCVSCELGYTCACAAF